MTEDLQSHQLAPESRPPEGMEHLLWIDLSPLSVDKVAALHRFARNNDGWLLERIDNVFDHLPKLNPERAKAILTARIDSPVFEDRWDLVTGYQLYEFTKVDHDAGVVLLSRLLRDKEDAIRDHAKLLFLEQAASGLPDDLNNDETLTSSKEWVAHIDELDLHDRTGLFKPDVEALLEAADSPNRYDPGREALRELQEATGYAY